MINVALSLSLDPAHAAPLSLVTSGRTTSRRASQPQEFSSSKGSRVTVATLES